MTPTPHSLPAARLTFRGQGFATAAAAAVIERLFRSPGVTGVWAVTDPPYLASRRVLERLGMQLELDGEWDGRPSCVYRRRRHAVPGMPS